MSNQISSSRIHAATGFKSRQRRGRRLLATCLIIPAALVAFSSLSPSVLAGQSPGLAPAKAQRPDSGFSALLRRFEFFTHPSECAEPASVAKAASNRCSEKGVASEPGTTAKTETSPEKDDYPTFHAYIPLPIY